MANSLRFYNSAKTFFKELVFSEPTANATFTLPEVGGELALTTGDKTTGNVILGSGAIGYGIGNGGSVTQLTSKGTAVTINKLCGQITMNNAALAAGATVYFTVNNTQLLNNYYNVIIGGYWGATYPVNYRIELAHTATSSFGIRVTNITAGALSEALAINFLVLAGSVT